MTCLGLVCGRRVFPLLYMEGSFILLPADDMTTGVDTLQSRGHETMEWKIVLQRTSSCA